MEFMYKGDDNLEGLYTDPVPQGPKKNKNGFLIWLLIVVVAVIFAVIVVVGFGGSNSALNGGADETYTGGGDYIAILQVEGTISGSSDTDYFGNRVGYQHQWMMNQINRLMMESNNKGLLLYVNSGGGNVYESEELYEKLLEYKETTGRPIYTYMANTAASGAYLISLASDQIHANINTLTGSIGVYVGPLTNISGLLEKLGINAEIIKSGKNKAMGSVYSAATEEQVQIYQDYVNESYERFLNTVIQQRGLEESKARSICDGRFYTATQAKENGLIDEISTYGETIKAMMQENKGLESCNINQITYKSKKSIANIITGLSSLMKEAAWDFGKSELETALELAENTDNYTLKAEIN